ncbi:Imm61 family immunity protein [Arthrobacter sp. NPDC056691]|uniref:Imm61 family immunity protein n=1 Tax=Arthrobacter sp. NPDC056691 TaxID=3345913 RepID=UPI00367226AE
MSRFPELAKAANYSMARSGDDSWCLYNLGGEVQLYLREVDGRFVLTEAERERSERIVFVSPVLDDIEKFLVFRLTSLYRRRQGQPLLLVTPVPVTADSVAPGFSLRLVGDGLATLTEATTGVERQGRIIPLVEFSHYSALSADELRTYTLHPEASPVFRATNAV